MAWESVQPFDGDWIMIDPPCGVGDPTKQYRSGLNTVDNVFNLKSALAISQTGGRYLETVPGAEVITFLSHVVSLPKPGETEVVPHRSAFYRALGGLGIRLMKSGCNPLSLEEHHPFSIYYAELESPAVTFERARVLHGNKLSSHLAYPQGPGYAIVRRDTLAQGFTLGWCDPVDGRRSETFVDVAEIRHEHPGLEPTYKHYADPGGL